MHTPGIKVVMPSGPRDAKGLLESCIFDDDPCLYIEHMGLAFSTTEDVPVAGHVILQRPLPGERSAEVSRLFVVPAARRHGVASALLETAMRSAVANNLDLFTDPSGRWPLLWPAGALSAQNNESAGWISDGSLHPLPGVAQIFPQGVAW